MNKRNSSSRIQKSEIKTELLSIKLIQHNPNFNFDKYDWCQQFSEIVHQDKLKSFITVSNEKVLLIKGKYIYQWGLTEKTYSVKQEKSEIQDVTLLDQRCYILDKDKKVYKQNERSFLFQNIKSIRNFQNALILLTQDNQLLDEKQNKLKQNIEDVQSSIEFLAISTKSAVTIAGKFPFQQNLDIKVQKISCGMQHVMCLTQDGQVFIWGEGKNGQIGNQSLKQQQWPQLIMNNVQDIAAGAESSVILKSNKIYHCGTNEIINKQQQFVQYQSDNIFIKIYSSWSQNIDIQYAHYVDFDQELFDELTKIIKQIEEDDLLLPDENLVKQSRVLSTHEQQLNKKPVPPQIFGQPVKTMPTPPTSIFNKSRSKTPQKKLKFQLD